MINIEKMSDAVEIEIEQEPAVVDNHSEFMQAYKEIAAALPEAFHEKLMDLESGFNTAFILGCSFAYKKGLQDGVRFGGLFPVIADPR